MGLFVQVSDTPKNEGLIIVFPLTTVFLGKPHSLTHTHQHWTERLYPFFCAYHINPQLEFQTSSWLVVPPCKDWTHNWKWEDIWKVQNGLSPHITQGGTPPMISWGYNPHLTIDITSINPSYRTYKSTWLTMGHHLAGFDVTETVRKAGHLCSMPPVVLGSRVTTQVPISFRSHHAYSCPGRIGPTSKIIPK